MKAKWLQPFTPFIFFAFPPPADFVLRVATVLGLLLITGVYLAASRPWEVEGRRAR